MHRGTGIAVALEHFSRQTPQPAAKFVCHTPHELNSKITRKQKALPKVQRQRYTVLVRTVIAGARKAVLCLVYVQVGNARIYDRAWAVAVRFAVAESRVRYIFGVFCCVKEENEKLCPFST